VQPVPDEGIVDTQALIESLEIDEHVLCHAVGGYFDEVEKRYPLIGADLKANAEQDLHFMNRAMRAAADAIVYSTLACVLSSDEEFSSALDLLRPVDDEFLNKMRRDLFDASMTVAEGELRVADPLAAQSALIRKSLFMQAAS
jgi:hypothetical protein